jgi:hypothetical protein
MVVWLTLAVLGIAAQFFVCFSGISASIDSTSPSPYFNSKSTKFASNSCVDLSLINDPNRKRLHSKLGYISPKAFEAKKVA